MRAIAVTDRAKPALPFWRSGPGRGVKNEVRSTGRVPGWGKAVQIPSPLI